MFFKFWSLQTKIGITFDPADSSPGHITKRVSDIIYSENHWEKLWYTVYYGTITKACAENLKSLTPN